MPAHDCVDVLSDTLRQIDDLAGTARSASAIAESAGVRDNDDNLGAPSAEISR
jgi:hypothetical protein